MVTMAKGIGNGFPVGAVVTTPGEIKIVKNKKPSKNMSPSIRNTSTTFFFSYSFN